MAKKVKIDLTGSADGLQAALKTAGGSIKVFAADSQKSLNSVEPKSFLDKLAQGAKGMGQERRQSGEMALERMMSGEGLSRMGMQAMGLGMTGVVAEGTGRMFSGGVDIVSKMMTETGPQADKMVKELIAGLPVVGAWAKGLGDMWGLIDGSTQRAAKLTHELEKQKQLHEFTTGTEKLQFDTALTLTEDPRKRAQMQIAEGKHEQFESLNKQIDEDAKNGKLMGEGEYLKRADAINDNAAAKQAEADEKENRRHESSMLGMEQKIAAARLDIQKMGAHNASDIWTVTLAGINQKTKNELADIDNKIKNDKSLRPDEIAKLQEERKALAAQGEAQTPEAGKQFWNQVGQNRRGVEGSLLGDAASMISQLQTLGGNNPQAERMQKLLSAYSFNNSMNGQLDQILKNESATSSQKNAAGQAKGVLAHLTETLTSDKALNPTPYIPLRLAAAEDVGGGRYSGAANTALEKDNANYAATQTDYQKQMVGLLTSLNTIIPQAMNRTDSGDSVFGPQP